MRLALAVTVALPVFDQCLVGSVMLGRTLVGIVVNRPEIVNCEDFWSKTGDMCRELTRGLLGGRVVVSRRSGPYPRLARSAFPAGLESCGSSHIGRSYAPSNRSRRELG